MGTSLRRLVSFSCKIFLVLFKTHLVCSLFSLDKELIVHLNRIEKKPVEDLLWELNTIFCDDLSCQTFP